MQICKVTVSYYRNIDGVTIYLNPECNYIIGENNLGKSNLLALIRTICNGKSFDDKDFSTLISTLKLSWTSNCFQASRAFSAIIFRQTMLRC